MSHKIIFGLRDGEVVHISDVENGLKCNTICPLCKTKLVAKKGSKNKHHFTHYNSEDCKGGFETSLHLAAKEIISNSKEFRIPAVYLNFPKSYKKSELIKESQMIYVDKVYLEKKIDNIIPDIVIESKGKKLIVEIFVTHKVDDNKLNKIKKIGISTLEINLSDWIREPDLNALEELIIREIQNKKWLYNKLENEIYQKFNNIAQPFKLNKFIHSHECPLNNSFYKGVNSIRWGDCIYCEYCFSAHGERNCLGYARVSKIEDFSKSFEQREHEWILKENERKLQERQIKEQKRLEEKRLKEVNAIVKERYKQTQIKKGYCPYCLNVGLVQGRGNYKDYRVCYNFPRCGYKVKIL